MGQAKRETLERGIEKIGNIYRASCSIDGEHLTEYCYSLDEARRWRQEMQDIARNFDGRRERAVFRSRKRSDTKHPDLPVGLFQKVTTRKNKDGSTRSWVGIGTQLTRNGKVVKAFLRCYGTIRTREEAIVEVLELRRKAEIDLEL